MIKLVYTIRRREGMTREQFQRYWRREHARSSGDTPRLFASAATCKPMRVTPTSTSLSPVRAEARRHYDGVAELWWESIDDLLEASMSDEGRIAGQALLEDERRFIDLPNSPIWMGEENVVIEVA